MSKTFNPLDTPETISAFLADVMKENNPKILMLLSVLS